MKRPLSLRAHLLIGAALWTVGLFGLGIVTWHVTLGNAQPPALFYKVHSHTSLVALACVALLAAGLLQFRLGWSPINQLRTRLSRIREARERRLEGEYPSEVEPLVADLNALLTQREEMISHARAKAGDLAHGLKTPLAVLAQEAERAAAAGHAELAATILEQVTRMQRQIDYQLAQARVGVSNQPVAAARTSVRESVDGLVRTLARLHDERGIEIGVDVAPQLVAFVAREDLDEMLGNLLDNACKWARRRCAVAATCGGDRVAITIDDDGAGLAPTLRAEVLRRGVRADEALPGSGLGLSIVRDLVHAHGGSVTLDGSPMGGLRVTIDLPGDA
jgi:signal transduction histidine kinase